MSEKGSPAPRLQSGSDGLFSLACAEQLEQYSGLEMDGERVNLSSPEKNIRTFRHERLLASHCVICSVLPRAVFALKRL